VSTPLKLRGLEKARKKLEALRQQYPRAAAAALFAEGLAIEAESVKLVPVDTGRLRATHYCSPPEDGPGGPVVHVGYGTDYALAVHERMHAYHPVGEAKFLEIPLKAASSGFASRMADRIKRFVASGKGMDVLSSGSSSSTAAAASAAGAARQAKSSASRKPGAAKRKRARIAKSLRPRKGK